MLKTKNYEVKRLGQIMPEAFAVLDKLENISNGVWKATFVVGNSRKNAINKKSFEIKTINFKWDRKANISEVAYSEAKKQLNNQKVISDGIFTGWEDDREV